MAHWNVYWSKQPGDVRSSNWYELGGVITYASGQLKQWEGRRHGDLVATLVQGGKHVVWWASDKPLYPTLLGPECVPPTAKYHRQLLANVEQLLKLLEH